jgi:glycosyltransferase involved in cell wall biosynthesis
MRVSVVVPTRDRPGALGECLRALAAQTQVQDQGQGQGEGEGVGAVEIVVVDDASVDAEAVAAVVARAPGARLVRGEGRGPAAARNLGARQATGEVLCFTDDDCRPDPGWVAALVGRIEAGAEAVAGPTRSGRPGDSCAAAAQTVTNHLVEASHDPGRGTVGFAPTSNLACRAALHRELPFDEDYPLAAGEDRDWCARLTARGAAIAYEPEAVVAHHPDLSLRRFWRQQLRYGRGAHRFRRGADGQRRRPLLRFYVDLLVKGFRQGPAVGGLVLVAQVATLVGVAAEVVEGIEGIEAASDRRVTG